jgi:ParB-like chromosome segregation protein Spo0J
VARKRQIIANRKDELRHTAQASQFASLAVTALRPHPNNPRKHTPEQVRAITRSIEAFGFNAPVLIDKDNQIVAGHGRFEAAKLSGRALIPVIRLHHLSPEQARAYMLADNKLSDRSSWDDTTLAVHLKELSALVLDFHIEATGFEPPEIDFRIQSLDVSR